MIHGYEKNHHPVRIIYKGCHKNKGENNKINIHYLKVGMVIIDNFCCIVIKITLCALVFGKS